MSAFAELMAEGAALGAAGRSFLSQAAPYGGQVDPTLPIEERVVKRLNLMRANYQVNRLRANATTLREEDWKRIDRDVIQVAMAPQVITNFLWNWNGGALRYSFDGFEATLLGRDTVSDTAPAEIGMRPSQRTPNDRQVYSRTYIPLPFIYKDYDLDIREVRMSQKQGMPLDTSLAIDAAAQVGDFIEETVVIGKSTTMIYKSSPLYGLLDFSGTQNATIGVAWTTSGKTGAQKIDDVLTMILASTTAKHYGPWALFIPDAWRTELSVRCYDYDSRNVQQVILDLPGIVACEVAPKLTANVPLLINLSPQTVQIAEGMPVANIPWEGPAPFEDMHHKVIGMRLPRLGMDYDGNCGIVKGTCS